MSQNDSFTQTARKAMGTDKLPSNVKEQKSKAQAKADELETLVGGFVEKAFDKVRDLLESAKTEQK